MERGHNGCTEDRRQRTEDRGQKTEDRRQRTEDRRQRTEDRGQRTEDRRQRTEDRGQKTEDRGQRTEDRRQRTEDRGQKTKDLDTNLAFQISNRKIVIKGAGEMATGIAHRLFMANFKHIVMTEIEQPLTVRRTVAFSESVYMGSSRVEDVTALLVKDTDDIPDVWRKNCIAVIVDPKWNIVKAMKPDIVVDAIMAKRNIGTKKDEASIVIGVGPGFTAPVDVHAVVESNRGHYLGRAIYNGFAEPHTGIPGPVMGITAERVLRSPHAGLVKLVCDFGDKVKRGDVVMYVDSTPVLAPIEGVVRGLIREIYVSADEKIGDIDPRGIKDYCYTITEKARAIGGGVLEAVMHLMNSIEHRV